MLANCAELVAAKPTSTAGWEIHVIRYGRLAAAGVAGHGQDPLVVVDRLRASGEVVADPPILGPAASLTEVGHIHRWLAATGVRLVVAEPELAMPISAAHGIAQRLRCAQDRQLPGVVDLRRQHAAPPAPPTRISRIAGGPSSDQRLGDLPPRTQRVGG